MTHNHHRIANTIRKCEKRIQEAIESNEHPERIIEIETEHIDRLRDLLAEPMSENIIEEDFSVIA